jgi:hypothetical protein
MHTVFCGRVAEMAALQQSFERIKAGDGPELFVILAEAGLGKTRLAQEFYNWLSTRHDGVGGHGYWPDELDQRDNNLMVNPRPEDCLPRHDLPYLWWGLRLADPGRAGGASRWAPFTAIWSS